MTSHVRSLVQATFVALAVSVPAAAQTLRPAPSVPPPAQPPAPAAPASDPRVDTSRPSAANTVRVPAPEPDQYRIGPEDTLEISVWKNQDLSRTVVVRPDGKISVPLLNDLQAGGMTPLQLRDVLIKGYSAYQPEPEVAVIVQQIHSIKVSVIGGVKTPGQYELKSQATVLEALALAGGFSDFAKRDQIVVMRRGPRTTLRLPFNYSKVALVGEEENFFVQPGDTIIVPN
jgi:polysaccharide biosynthesis/export protein